MLTYVPCTESHAPVPDPDATEVRARWQGRSSSRVVGNPHFQSYYRSLNRALRAVVLSGYADYISGNPRGSAHYRVVRRLAADAWARYLAGAPVRPLPR